VALVTGANTGIGYAIAERLLEDGYALGYATEDRGAGEHEAYHRLAHIGRVHWVSGDLSDRDVPARLVAETAEALGGIDVLVNNAGLSTSGPALELTAEDFDVTFAVDVRAAFLASQEAAKRMTGGGVIVNITSIHETTPRPGLSVYAAAKAALGMLTRAFALELAPRGIRVVAVAPGLVHTPMIHKHAAQLTPEIWAKIEACHPLGMGRPDDVAAAVAFLASSDARWITGITLPLGWAYHYPLPTGQFME
jgi:NAD(P)-dependent dehydrogenase (short-subunit alcohol dehydrogenase family)